VTGVASAQTWQTVDNFQYVPGQDAGNAGLVFTPNGTLFAAGWAFDGNPGVGHALIMASSDAGNTWSGPLDDFTHVTGDSAYYNTLTSDANGILYGAGEADAASSGAANWFVRRSTDAGFTWSTVDFLPGAANKIAIDSAGNVYVAGGAGNNSWTIRKGIGGTNFTTVDSFAAGSYGAQAIFVHATAGIFAAGNAAILTNTVKSGKTTSTTIDYGWTVRRSTNGGASWSTVDAFSLSGVPGGFTGAYYDASAFSIGADADGNLYVVGSANAVSGSGNRTTYSSHWVVRKSSDGGKTWSTVDNILSSTGYGFQTAALGFVADSNGNLFVVGQNLSNWIVRENPGGTGSWQTIDDFKYAFGSTATSVVTDTSGYTFVGGYGGDNSGMDHWLIRKR
jgi:hypothetical protein